MISICLLRKPNRRLFLTGKIVQNLKQFLKIHNYLNRLFRKAQKNYVWKQNWSSLKCSEGDANDRLFTREQTISLATEPWTQVVDKAKGKLILKMYKQIYCLARITSGQRRVDAWLMSIPSTVWKGKVFCFFFSQFLSWIKTVCGRYDLIFILSEMKKCCQNALPLIWLQ